eukprot:COSAG01_NODE_20893_length_929_cov_1.242169_2_plen_144_part_00
MDTALVQYAVQRAIIKGLRTVGELKLADLLDPRAHEDSASKSSITPQSVDSPSRMPRTEHELQTASDVGVASSPDTAALHRGTSLAPKFTKYDVESSPRIVSPKRLSDHSRTSFCVMPFHSKSATLLTYDQWISMQMELFVHD